MPVLTQTHAIPLSELTFQIGEAINSAFFQSTYWVIADVSNHTFYPNKFHHYFELVEKDAAGISITAKMQAVAWKNGAARIQQFETLTGQRFKAGIKVSVKVQVEYHETFGLKLVVQDVDPAFTLGQLELHRLATINRLLTECPQLVQKACEGFRTRNNTLDHKMVIQRIAVVSSSSSAGYQDFMHTLRNNRFGYIFSVRSFYTSVQGEVNAEAAATKLEEICASNTAYDAVVIIRGGGADTDFLIFDQFVLCAAVAKLHIPVITGLGHLKNQTLVDLMAHTSTNAPTKAAEFIIAHNNAFETLIQGEQKKVVIKAQQILARQQQSMQVQQAAMASRVRNMLMYKKEAQGLIKQKVATQSRKGLHIQQTALRDTTSKVLNKPLLHLSKFESDLKHQALSLKSFTGNYFRSQQKDLSLLEARCCSMSPLEVLKRGFAIVYYQGGIVTNGSSLEAGAAINIRLLDSTLKATITQKQQANGDTFEL